MSVCVCMREQVTLEVVYKVHNPFPLSLFELITLPITDAFSILCKRQRKVRRLVDRIGVAVTLLRLQRKSLEAEILKINQKC